jgi:hypothetical protein
MFDALCQSLPRLTFNKEGNLLSVSITDGGFKVLDNVNGIKFLGGNEANKALIDVKVCICHSSLSLLRLCLDK